MITKEAFITSVVQLINRPTYPFTRADFDALLTVDVCDCGGDQCYGWNVSNKVALKIENEKRELMEAIAEKTHAFLESIRPFKEKVDALRAADPINQSLQKIDERIKKATVKLPKSQAEIEALASGLPETELAAVGVVLGSHVEHTDDCAYCNARTTLPCNCDPKVWLRQDEIVYEVDLDGNIKAVDDFIFEDQKQENKTIH